MAADDATSGCRALAARLSDDPPFIRRPSLASRATALNAPDEPLK